jgi:hypothetical protein
LGSPAPGGRIYDMRRGEVYAARLDPTEGSEQAVHVR